MKISIELNTLQPSQLYLNRNKLRTLIMDGFDSDQLQINPLPVIKYQGELVLIDGHTRAFLANQQGINEITVEYHSEVENLFVYHSCVDWCKREDITTISDLGKQIISAEDYQREWITHCEKLIDFN